MKMKGIVMKGKNRGKELGFPTANIVYSGDLESGVYAGGVLAENKKYKAGIFRDKANNLIEAHILNFSGDLYGQEIEVEILNKLREVVKFENEEELIKQIAEDISRINNL